MLKSWTVYGLICPKRECIFYVGMSKNPKNRLLNHMSDPSCAPYPYCQDLRAEGLKPKIITFATFSDKPTALFMEARLIKSLEPVLVNNRAHNLCLGNWRNLDTPLY